MFVSVICKRYRKVVDRLMVEWGGQSRGLVKIDSGAGFGGFFGPMEAI